MLAALFLSLVGLTCLDYDLNGDGSVDSKDLSIMLDNWGDPWNVSDKLNLLAFWGECDLAQLVVQPDATSGKDTYIVSTEPNTNKDGENTLFILPTGGAIMRILIEMDISAIPRESFIESATLNVFDQSITPVDIEVYPITVEWESDEATYNDRKTGVAWSNPGGSGDFDISIFDLGQTSGSSTAIDVQNTVEDAVMNKAGIWSVIVIAQTEPVSGAIIWHASEFTPPAGTPPKLTVNYASPVATTVNVVAPAQRAANVVAPSELTANVVATSGRTANVVASSTVTANVVAASSRTTNVVPGEE